MLHGPGYTFFKCETCGSEHIEKSRDCASPSHSICLNDNCSGYAENVGCEFHYEWPVDKWGNLIKKE